MEEYESIICLDAKNNTFFVCATRENGNIQSPKIYNNYEESAEELIRRFALPEQVEYIIGETRLDVVLRKLDQFGEHILYGDTMDRVGEIHHKRLRFSYYNKEEKIIFITRTDCTEIFWNEREEKKILMAAFQESKLVNHAKTEFLATMTREFRTPLNSIIGTIAMAGTHLEDTERIMDCLNKINDSSQQLLSMVNEAVELVDAPENIPLLNQSQIQNMFLEDSRDVENTAMEKLDLQGKKVLMAEDNAITRHILKAVLKNTGVEIQEVVNGQELLRFYQEAEPFTYDAIFMDVNMPKVDGYEAAMRIRQMGREDAALIPIFGITENPLQEENLQRENTGMDAYFARPFHFERIAEALQKFLR